MAIPLRRVGSLASNLRSIQVVNVRSSFQAAMRTPLVQYLIDAAQVFMGVTVVTTMYDASGTAVNLLGLSAFMVSLESGNMKVRLAEAGLATFALVKWGERWDNDFAISAIFILILFNASQIVIMPFFNWLHSAPGENWHEDDE